MSTVIRFAAESDAAALAEIYAPAVTERTTSFELVAPTAADMARRMSALRERYPWLVCESDGRVIGYAYASPHRERLAYQWSVDVSAYVRDDAQRRGVGRALYTALFAILAMQGYRTAYAGITLPNAASEGMHRALGFEPVGIYRGVGYKMGAWRDVVWLARSLAPRVDDPPAPLPIEAVAGDDAIARAIAECETLLRRAAAQS
ncbi:MAG: arsinothricin resistance N-acetyltransferase ArsN1 family B [Gemmatimonadaceae bacterium]